MQESSWGAGSLGQHLKAGWAPDLVTHLVYNLHNNNFASAVFLEVPLSFLQVNSSDSQNKHGKRRCGELHTNDLKKLFETNDEVFRKYLKDKERIKEAVGICKEQIV